MGYNTIPDKDGRKKPTDCQGGKNPEYMKLPFSRLDYQSVWVSTLCFDSKWLARALGLPQDMPSPVVL